MNDITTTTEPDSPSSPSGLVLYEAMCRAITECARVDEAKVIRDKHMALEVYAKQSKNHEAERQATAIRLRAEHRVGELLKELPRAATASGGDVKSAPARAEPIRPSPYAQALADNEITTQEASAFQQLADVPTEALETALATEKPAKAVKEAVKRTRAAKKEPKGPSKLDIAKDAVRPLLAAALPIGNKHVFGAKIGVSHVTVDSAVAAVQAEMKEAEKLAADEAALDAKLLETPLSATAQRKLEAYERRVEARLTAEFRSQFDQEVGAEVDRLIAHRDTYDAGLIAQVYEWHSRRNHHPFTNEEFRLILAALHPDAKDPARRQEAFNVFKLKELLLRKPEAKLKVNPLAGLREKIEARRARR